MSAEGKSLRLAEGVRGDHEQERISFWSLRLDERLGRRREDRRVLARAVIAAILIHVGVLLARFPEIRTAVLPKAEKNVVFVKKYVPPPPRFQKREIVKTEFKRKIPIPDPSPDDPEPIREPEPEIEPEPLPPDVDVLLGIPQAPPLSGPLFAGVGNVTSPVRIGESYVQPGYPEVARLARLEGQVILQAVVRKNGTVGEIEVLRSNPPNMDFEIKAIEAVTQWRYEPATQNGVPVDVYFTIIVDFSLV